MMHQLPRAPQVSLMDCRTLNWVGLDWTMTISSLLVNFSGFGIIVKAPKEKHFSLTNEKLYHEWHNYTPILNHVGIPVI